MLRQKKNWKKKKKDKGRGRKIEKRKAVEEGYADEEERDVETGSFAYGRNVSFFFSFSVG
jgi:hypothetical protein